MIRKIKYNNKEYSVKTAKTGDNSNYNIMLSIFDGKVLLCGTMIKETDSPIDSAIDCLKYHEYCNVGETFSEIFLN